MFLNFGILSERAPRNDRTSVPKGSASLCIRQPRLRSISQRAGEVHQNLSGKMPTLVTTEADILFASSDGNLSSPVPFYVREIRWQRKNGRLFDWQLPGDTRVSSLTAPTTSAFGDPSPLVPSISEGFSAHEIGGHLFVWHAC